MPAPLPPRAAYRIWAPFYDRENPVTVLEDAATSRLTPPLQGRTLLDAACGTARRLPGTDAVRAIGLDAAPEMLEVASRSVPGARLVQGDLRALPFRDACADVVWCRLAIGHVREIDAAYAELGRVCRAGGRVIVTDFHPEAVAAGHTRSFREPGGAVIAIEHTVHTAQAQIAAARRCGLALAARLEPAVGPAVRDLYEAAGAVDRYAGQLGLPLVLALSFERRAPT